MDTEKVGRLVDEAGFIFRGRILPYRPYRTGDAPAIPAEAGETLTAEIEEVLRSTEVLRGLAGRKMTIVTKNAAALLEDDPPRHRKPPASARPERASRGANSEIWRRLSGG